MKEIVICDTCRKVWADDDSLQMVKGWLAGTEHYAPCPNISCPGELFIAQSFATIKGSIQQRQPDGTLIGIEFHGEVDKMDGSMEQASEVVLEAEMHGNDGKSRIHLFLE